MVEMKFAKLSLEQIEILITMKIKKEGILIMPTKQQLATIKREFLKEEDIEELIAIRNTVVKYLHDAKGLARIIEQEEEAERLNAIQTVITDLIDKKVLSKF